MSNFLGTGSVSFAHQEFLADVVGSEWFSKVSYNINPGLDYVFPWLSQVASAFQEYRFSELQFIFKSTSGDLVTSTSPALGTVIMGTNFNAVEDLFIDKRAMENAQNTVSTKPSNSLVHTVNLQNPLKANYIRSGPVPDHADQRLYDIGNFTLGTVGMQSAAEGKVIGELWVSYKVSLFKPRYNNASGVESQSIILGGDPSTWNANNAPFAGASTLIPVSGPPTTFAAITIPGSIGFDLVNVNKITMPVDSIGKVFRLDWVLAASSLTSAGPVVYHGAVDTNVVHWIKNAFAYSNDKNLQTFTSGTSTFYHHSNTVATNRLWLSAYFSPDQAKRDVSFVVSSGTTFPGGVVLIAQICITEIDPTTILGRPLKRYVTNGDFLN